MKQTMKLTSASGITVELSENEYKNISVTFNGNEVQIRSLSENQEKEEESSRDGVHFYSVTIRNIVAFDPNKIPIIRTIRNHVGVGLGLADAKSFAEGKTFFVFGPKWEESGLRRELMRNKAYDVEVYEYTGSEHFHPYC